MLSRIVFTATLLAIVGLTSSKVEAESGESLHCRMTEERDFSNTRITEGEDNNLNIAMFDNDIFINEVKKDPNGESKLIRDIHTFKYGPLSESTQASHFINWIRNPHDRFNSKILNICVRRKITANTNCKGGMRANYDIYLFNDYEEMNVKDDIQRNFLLSSFSVDFCEKIQKN